MISINKIIYEIDIEVESHKVDKKSKHENAFTWVGLSELDSKPSIFFRNIFGETVCVSIADLQTLLALPVVAQLLEESANNGAK